MELIILKTSCGFAILSHKQGREERTQCSNRRCMTCSPADTRTSRYHASYSFKGVYRFLVFSMLIKNGLRMALLLWSRTSPKLLSYFNSCRAPLSIFHCPLSNDKETIPPLTKKSLNLAINSSFWKRRFLNTFIKSTLLMRKNGWRITSSMEIRFTGSRTSIRVIRSSRCFSFSNNDLLM